MKRRSLLAGAGAATLAACAGTPRGTPPRFTHGVASGDPASDSVVLWTRLVGARDGTPLEWVVAEDRRLRRVVARGSVPLPAARDGCCKVVAGGLEPGRTYHFAFRHGSQRSPVGRTRTLPAGQVDALRFAVVSCAHVQQGNWSAYRAIAEGPALDAVLHLGDYIYEYGDESAGTRPVDPPHETLTLADYRRRYAFYRSQAPLLACHAAHPFIAVWDDHEIANDAWTGGAENHDPAREGPWDARRAAARQAWLEWMPVREPADGQGIYRQFAFGELADLVLLDTRHDGRDRQAASPSLIAEGAVERRMISAAQERWLLGALDVSQRRGAAWRLLGQQVIFAPLGPHNQDQWDGYPAARQRILDHVRHAGIRDLVVLTGDIHSAWAIEVHGDPADPAGYDPASGEGSVAVEFVTPGVSSTPLGEYLQAHDPRRLAGIEQALGQLPQVRFAELFARGFLDLRVTPEAVDAGWWFVQDPRAAQSPLRLAHQARVEAGRGCLSRA